MMEELTSIEFNEIAKKWRKQGLWQCRVCGCTEAEGYLNGCYWVEENLCSNCAQEVKE